MERESCGMGGWDGRGEFVEWVGVMEGESCESGWV